MLLKKTVGIDEQVVEIHSICKSAPFGIPLVYLIDRGDSRTHIITSQTAVVLVIRWRYKIALCCRYTLCNCIGLIHLVIELHLLDYALHKTS